MSSYHGRQHKEIAEILRDVNADDLTIESFIDLFSDDNHNFDEQLFRATSTDREGY